MVTLDRVYLKLSSGTKEFRVFDLLLYEHANMWCVSWFHPCVDSLSCVYECCQQGCNFTSYLTWQMLPLSRPSLTSPLVLSPLLSHTLPSLPLPSSSPCFSLRKHLYHMILNWFHTDFSFRCYSLDCYSEYGKLASCFTEWSMCTTCVSYKLSFIAILPSFSCKQHHGLYP